MDKKRVLGNRRNRVIANLLSFKEAICDPYLSEEASKALRKEILDQINDLCQFAFDLLDDENITWNELFFERLDKYLDEREANGDS